MDMNRANEVRPVFRKLGMIAEKTGCAIVLIGHLNKSSGTQSTYRGLGSIDIMAAVRSLIFIGKVRKDPTTRVLIHEKSSLAPPGETMAFKLGDEEGFRWVAESSKQIQIFIDTLSVTCRLPVHEYFQVSGVSKSRLTDNIEKRIIIIRGGISHTNTCVGGVGNGSNERLCCPSG